MSTTTRGHVDADDYTWDTDGTVPAQVQAFGSVETYPERNDKRVAELERRVERLERALADLSGRFISVIVGGE